MYNVLWIDDEYEKMQPFSMMCSTIYGINLSGYKYREEGIHHLEQELDKWDAVLLDAKMLERSDDETTSIKGLRKSIDKIHDLSIKRYLPYFISTGQPDLMTDEMFEDSFGKFYVKGRDDEQLIADMIKEMDNAARKKLEFVYSDVIDAIQYLAMDKQTIINIIDILEAMHYPANHTDFTPVKEYNSLRQTLEFLFRACEKFGLVPSECIPKNIVNLRDCSFYLSGMDTVASGVRYGEEGEYVVPDYIANILKTILNIGNIHSHTVDIDETDRKILETFFGTINSRYYIFGLTLQLCDVIIWFAKYISKPSHADKAMNLSKCRHLPKSDKSLMQPYEGVVCTPVQDAEGIWHYEKCMLKLKFWNGEKKLKLKDITLNTDKTTKGKYPYFAKYEFTV